MNEFYDEELAEIYDLLYPDLGESDQIAQYLHVNAPGDRIIEFGVGTGHLAIPLAQRGLIVHGIDNSEEMLRKMAAKDLRGLVASSVHDFGRDEMPEGEFDACLLACNTICSVLDVTAQRRIFANAARSLNEDGIFVVQTFNPLWLQQRGTEFTQMRTLNADLTLIEQYKIFPTVQEIVVLNTLLRHAGGVKSFTHRIRFMHPFEMDAHAMAAGFELQERHGDFCGNPYTATSPHFVSTYLKVGEW